MTPRIIECRAWSPKWKKMIYPGVDGYTIDVHAHTIWLDGCDDECAVLMQFTGLLDKNRNKIYEGDILHWISPDDDEETENSVVSFEEYAFGTRVLFPKKTDFSEFCGDDAIVDGIATDLEVIGNVYETMDLIKRKSKTK